MALEEDSGYVSLADLAAMNTDEIEAIESRTPAPGVFRVKGLTVGMKQGEAQEGKPPLTRVNWTLEIVGGKPVDKSVDIEKLVGRKISQSYTLWPDDMIELLGLMKGMYQKVGLPMSGMPLGGLEGAEPGWLDTVVGHEFDIRIRTALVKSGEKRAFFDWLKPEVAKESAE